MDNAIRARLRSWRRWHVGLAVCAAGALSGCERTAPAAAESSSASPAESAQELAFRAWKPKRFNLVEASISDIQRAIQAGEITCKQLVQAYIARSTAYNGPCTRLVTADGAPIAPAQGYTRAGTLFSFPTETVPISSMLPDFDQYAGLPIEFGRMEASASDPSVQQQMGFLTGIPNAGQVNALETLNVRGERSVTCKGDFDLHPSKGALPADAPAECELFRQQPDALERAAELDRKYGRKPDLRSLPMYCVSFSVKNWYDAKDMRSTGGNDVAFAMDAPPGDSTMVAELRAKGAIILAKSIASQVNNTTASGPASASAFFPPSTDNGRATWGGTVCNPYDTARSPGFSSGGAGASVAANLVTCGICETTGGSCRIPANANNVASLVTTKGIISSDRGWTAMHVNHRPGVLCRTIGDAAKVLDAMRNPDTGYFDSNDAFTALPRPLIPSQPYASFVVDDADLARRPRLLAGMRVGVVREFFIKPNPNNVAINDQIEEQVKDILRGSLGATLVESVDPLYPDDPSIPDMTYTFQDGFAEIMGVNAPEYFFQTVSGGALEFAVPGFDVTSKDYLVKLSLGLVPLSPNLNLRRVTSGLDNTLRTPFLMDRYLLERGDTKVNTMAAFVANGKWFADTLRASSQNTATRNVQDMRPSSGIDRLKMVTIARMVVSKVMYENDLTALVIPNIPAPVERNEFARDPVVKDVRPNGPSITDLLGVPEVIIPAGYNQIVYEAKYQLSADKTTYTQVPGSEASLMERPMPISVMFWGGPGDEPRVLKVASAYEAATHHRAPPPGFGPLPGEP